MFFSRVCTTPVDDELNSGIASHPGSSMNTLNSVSHSLVSAVNPQSGQSNVFQNPYQQNSYALNYGHSSNYIAPNNQFVPNNQFMPNNQFAQPSSHYFNNYEWSNYQQSLPLSQNPSDYGRNPSQISPASSSLQTNLGLPSNHGQSQSSSASPNLRTNLGLPHLSDV